MSPETNSMSLAKAVDHMADGDLLLFRGYGVFSFSKLIRTASRSIYSHAAMYCVWNGIPAVMEMCEGVGGRCVSLRSQVKDHPGRWDVYRVRQEFEDQYDRAGAVRHMFTHSVGEPYGWTAIYSAALLHLPFVRLFIKPEMDDIGDPSWLPKFCSFAVSTSARLGGKIDPVPNISDRITEPGDLSHSMLWRYAFTLDGVD